MHEGVLYLLTNAVLHPDLDKCHCKGDPLLYADCAKPELGKYTWLRLQRQAVVVSLGLWCLIALLTGKQ